MKLKKFFAGVLAAAMMLTVGATAAFATEPISVPAGEGDQSYNGAKVIVADTEGHAYLKLTKVLEVKEGTAPDKMTFNFTVANATGSVDFEKKDNENGAAFTKGEYKRTFNIDLMQVLGNDAEKVGAHTYTISETDPQIPGIKQVRSSLTMIVTVINKTGELNKGYGYIVALRDANGTKVPADEAFKNSYGDNNLQSLELSKTIHGSLGNLNDTFTFNVKFSAKKGVNASQYKGVSVTTGNDHIADLNNTDNDGLLELDKTYTVTLGHEDSITFGNLPEGVTYEISENTTTRNVENKYVNDEYTVSVSDTKGATRINETAKTLVAVNEEGTHFGIKGTIATGTNPVAFHNTKEGTPDMGVVLDNAPYIAMLTIVAIGGVALMLNKRRRDEE